MALAPDLIYGAQFRGSRFLSHSHLDHLGTLPVLQEKQPAAEVFMTPAAAALSEVMPHKFRECDERQEAGPGHCGVSFSPITIALSGDAWHAKSLQRGVPRGFRQNVLATFYDAGHILVGPRA